MILKILLYFILKYSKLKHYLINNFYRGKLFKIKYINFNYRIFLFEPIHLYSFKLEKIFVYFFILIFLLSNSGYKNTFKTYDACKKAFLINLKKLKE